MTWRVGILGRGYMGTIREAELARRGDCEVACIVDGEGASTERAVEDPALDCIFVCLPNHLTCDVVCRALAAGKHVFAEKPPGVSVAEVRRMIAAEASSGKALAFGFNHRHHPAARAARARIDAGDLGELIWLRGVYGKPMDPDFARSWRARRAEAGGGILLDQGIHMLDLMRDFAGGFDDVRAFASSRPGSEVEEDVVAVLRSRAGRLATLHSSHTLAQPLFRLELGLREGTLVLRGLLSRSGRYGPEQLVEIRRDGSAERVQTFAQDDSWAREIDAFFTALAGGAPVRTGSTAEALETMLLVEALYAAAGLDTWTSSSSS